MEYNAKQILCYIEQTFEQYEDLDEQWTEQGVGGLYYYEGHDEDGNGIEVKVEVVGNEWAVEERNDGNESWGLVDIFRVGDAF